MRFVVLFFLSQAVFNFSIAQVNVNDLKEVIEAVFYEPKVYDRIFIDYKIETHVKNFEFLPETRYAFIFPDSTFQKTYPEIINRVYESQSIEKKFHTATLIKNDKGDILATIHFMDTNIQLVIVFDEIKFFKGGAQLIFHTTSPWRPRSTMNGKYVKIYSKLRKKANRYELQRLRIVDIKCCDDIWLLEKYK